MADKLITIATFGEPSQAEMSKAKLDDMGIECFLTEDATRSLYGYAAGTIRLQVMESVAQRALEALKVDGRKRCTQCGHEVEDSVKYCPNCGAESGDYRQREVTRWTYTKCGEQVEPQFETCWNCGTGKIGSAPMERAEPEPATVPTYLTAAIVAFFFCWPLGIPAIYYAGRTRRNLQAGDYDEAWETSDKAKKWCWISVVVGLVGLLLYLCLLLLAP